MRLRHRRQADATAQIAAGSLYDHVMALPNGPRHLAAERLRSNVREVLWHALRDATPAVTEAELGRRLGLSRRASRRILWGDGNLPITTIAEYLYELGIELRIEAVPFGTQRREIEQELDAESRRNWIERHIAENYRPENGDPS